LGPSLSDRDQESQRLLIDITRVFDEDKGRPGSPRISVRLQDEGKPASRHRVAKLMRDNGWRAKAAKKYKATTVIILCLSHLIY
jgi:transposase InsO family protein